MNLHEYQARAILAAHGLPFPPGDVAASPEAARDIAARLGGSVVVKAQVHAGGRGKAGGVRLARDTAEAGEVAAALLGMRIKELPVRQVLVVRAVSVAAERYIGITLDRAAARPVLIVSPAGGIDIEEVATRAPEQLFRALIDPRYGLLPHQASGLAFRLFADIAHVRAAADLMTRLAVAFEARGAALAELNPVALTADGQLVALDAKLVIDDNELPRHPALATLRDTADEPPAETAARGAGLSFIQLDGAVGCCVNGAGLAMATLDLVQLAGGRPANFLDIGGSSNPDKVAAALGILGRDPAVRVILVNIFGGITRCDDVARGIVAATTARPLGVPLVIRLTGTNEAEARALLTAAGFQTEAEMEDAVRRAVALAGP